MTERPIIFSTPMVKAVLDESKTMTRRIVRFPKWGTYQSVESDWDITAEKGPLQLTVKDGIVFEVPSGKLSSAMQDKILRCPYGQVGDSLWVRETIYKRLDVDEKTKQAKAKHYVLYKANNPDLRMAWHSYGNATPPIFMPRWASRINLEITGVRVEKINQITAEDAIAEGIESRDEEWTYQEANGDRHLLDFTTPEYKRYDERGDGWTRCPQLSFCTLWDKLNLKRGYGFYTKCWVWVIEFKMVTK